MQHRMTEYGREPIRAADRAEANLRFIRSAMERATRFTDISGVGMVLIGLSAIVTTFLASAQSSPFARATVWEGEAAVAITIGLLGTLHKARGSWIRLFAAPARKFAFGLVP